MSKGFMYLCAIIDWYSRFIIDWDLSNTLEADFCIDILKTSLLKNTCEIFNTDQGAQFTSNRFVNVLINHNIKISMDGRGRALDNIFIERFWRALKTECIYIKRFESVKELRLGLKEYFHYYNYERPHQSLQYKFPAQVYNNI